MWDNEREIFAELNRRLADAGMQLEIICVGGFVLSHNGMRATEDIDGFFKANALVESIIFDVGEKFGINTADEAWLNNSVQNMNDLPPKSACEPLYDFGCLKVHLAPLDYVAGMKLASCREQDIADVASILETMGIGDPADLKARLKAYGFAEPDESVVLEAFGRAYGMDWLEKYFIEHEEEILGAI